MSLFLDSNIPMYLIGKPHPHKVDAHRLIQSAIVSEERLVTNVEVLQEILHRYAAIGRRDMIQPAFDAVLGLVDEVFAIDEVDLDRAKDIVLGSTRLSARDALHVAVMHRHSVTRVMSFDADFDNAAGITRVH